MAHSSKLKCLLQESKQKVTYTERMEILGVAEWRDHPEAKSTSCFCGEPRFNAQYGHDDLQPSVMPLLGYPIPSSDIPGHQEHMWYT